MAKHFTDIGYYHIATHKAGEIGYNVPRERGTLDVWYDNKRWVYDQPTKDGYSVRQIKSAIVSAWEDIGTPMKISGTWPSYTVESV